MTKTTAQELAALPADEAEARANELTRDIPGERDQDWDAGATTWTFADGSQLRSCDGEHEALTTNTHNRPQNDEQLWDMVFGPNATPYTVSDAAKAERPGLLEYCEDSLAAALDEGMDLQDYGDDAVAALVRMALNGDRRP